MGTPRARSASAMHHHHANAAGRDLAGRHDAQAVIDSTVPRTAPRAGHVDVARVGRDLRLDAIDVDADIENATRYAACSMHGHRAAVAGRDLAAGTDVHAVIETARAAAAM